MDLREEMLAYKKRWELVEKKIQEEHQNASLELRWQQLNAAYAMGQQMELTRNNSSEARVFEIWTWLKNQRMPT
jgi:hypothetical protein